MDFLDPLHFNIPPLQEAILHRANRKTINFLAFCSGSWVKRSCHPLVMALVVSDYEIRVQESQVKQIPEEAVDAALAMTKLMSNYHLLTFSKRKHQECKSDLEVGEIMEHVVQEI